ncbi:hypothetical protein GGTG_01830 [Gaeumannomyces tritici R3-111a-1]|uniref:Uncharacterized protein n=1 Tax=Gaeumannomyces tritici (strain R3-111a-1) TaxID=644352 RepID=J3NKN9_GAET3|nr:hypothetical protein GGTG_01830 [Gaeumannomyces tritici R3-111a-1]EJT81856.1 hypothetical protein GGTG_01830 [Gaeumannomyces tritici R3-111a-1]
MAIPELSTGPGFSCRTCASATICGPFSKALCVCNTNIMPGKLKVITSRVADRARQGNHVRAYGAEKTRRPRQLLLIPTEPGVRPRTAQGRGLVVSETEGQQQMFISSSSFLSSFPRYPPCAAQHEPSALFVAPLHGGPAGG